MDTNPLTPLPCPCCGRAAEKPFDSLPSYNCPEDDCIGSTDQWHISVWNSFPRPAHPAEGLLREIVALDERMVTPELEEYAWAMEKLIAVIARARTFLTHRPPVEALVWTPGEPPRDDNMWLVDCGQTITGEAFWDNALAEWWWHCGYKMDMPILFHAPMPRGPGGGG